MLQHLFSDFQKCVVRRIFFIVVVRCYRMFQEIDPFMRYSLREHIHEALCITVVTRTAQDDQRVAHMQRCCLRVQYAMGLVNGK